MAISPKFHNVLADTYATEDRMLEMQNKRIAFLTTLIFCAPIFSTTSALADNRPQTPQGQQFQDSNSAYKSALEKFHQDAKAYEDKRRAINQTFKDTIEKAMAEARNSRNMGQSQMQKRQSMNLKDSAVVAATAARDAAIQALGEPPVPPLRVPGMSKGKKQLPQPAPTQGQ